MRIALVAPAPGVTVPPVAYGGIEREVADLALALVQRGHEVTVFGVPHPEHSKEAFGFDIVRLFTENDALTHLDELHQFDVVHDWQHLKPLRLARLRNYLSTTLWTDMRSGRDVYPSRAARDAFKDPGAPIVPLGVRIPEAVEEPESADWPEYLVPGRIAAFKGTDLAMSIAEQFLPDGARLTVAGYVGALADTYPGDSTFFSLGIRRRCQKRRWDFVQNPPEMEPFMAGCSGVLHLQRWLESFGLVIADALVRGIPVLTTDQGSPREMVRETDGGFAIPLKRLDMGDFSDPLIPAFFRIYWGAGRAGIAKRARALYDINVVVRQFEKLYERGLPG